MTTNRRALVIGGGIAGPAVALFLHRAGIAARVFEAYPRTDDIPGGFQIAPNGLRVLEELGLRDQVLAAGIGSEDFWFKNHHGKTIGVARTAPSGLAVNLARPELHRILRTATEARGIPIAYEKRLAKVVPHDGGITAHFEDGSEETADFIVGADGIRSRVRAWMLPDHASPRDTKMVSLGGFCPEGFVPDDGAGRIDRLVFVVGAKHQFGYSRMSAKRWGWWCHVAVSSPEEREQILKMPAADLKQKMLERYRGWCAPTTELVAHTETWVRTAIFDIPTLPTWHRGRAVLIGDAAHAMSPAGGLGASLALEDARALADAVAGGAPYEQAFSAFEAQRRPRAEKLVAQGYANDRRSTKELGKVGMWMRDHVLMPLIVPQIAGALAKVYAGGI